MDVLVRVTVDGPACGLCGTITRLFGSESHPLDNQLSVLTYVCEGCDTLQVETVRSPVTRIVGRQEQVVRPSMLMAHGGFDAETTSLLGAAFDVAWQTLASSRTILAREPQATSTRELLATSIISSASAGERDLNQLVQRALAQLNSSRPSRVAPLAVASSPSLKGPQA